MFADQQMLSPPPPDLLTRWSLWYPDAPPVGFLLREAYPDLWLRVHSLPDSKRYATSDAEHAEIHERHNRVATEHLGAGTACALLLHTACGGSEVALPRLVRGANPASVLAWIGELPAELWDEQGGIFVSPICLYGASFDWQPGAVDPFLRLVADDRARGLAVELEHGRVYAPYDGGADLFFSSSFERDLARERYQPWLSAHSDGL